MRATRIGLVGGTGRSGTTILVKIFSRHPDVASVPEWRFLIDPDGIVDFYATCQAWSPYHYDLKVKRLERVLRKVAVRHPLSRFFWVLQRWGISRNVSWKLLPQYFGPSVVDHCPGFLALIDALMDKLVAFQYDGSWEGMKALERKKITYNSFPEKEKLGKVLGDFLREVVQRVIKHDGGSLYLEKNTWNILWFDKILELLPEARMVHIYRDPRDIVASFTKQTWMPSDPRKSARICKDLIERWRDIQKRVPGDSFMEISLEALTTDPESVLRSICRFWGVPWHQSLLDIDLSKSHAGRWKKDFNASEQRTVQAILQEPLEAMGYE